MHHEMQCWQCIKNVLSDDAKGRFIINHQWIPAWRSASQNHVYSSDFFSNLFRFLVKFCRVSSRPQKITQIWQPEKRKSLFDWTAHNLSTFDWWRRVTRRHCFIVRGHKWGKKDSDPLIYIQKILTRPLKNPWCLYKAALLPNMVQTFCFLSISVTFLRETMHNKVLI